MPSPYERRLRPQLVLPYNQNLLAANDFSSGWSASNGTLSVNSVRDIDDKLRGASFVEDGTNNAHNFAITFSKAASAIAYEWIDVARVRRNGALRTRTLFIFNGSFSSGVQTNVDLRTGEIVATDGTFGSFTNIARSTRYVGNGFWLTSVLFTTDAVADLTIIPGAALPPSTSPYTGDSISGVEFFGGILRLQ